MVSIITPVFNASSYIAQNIESVKNQTFIDYEHILIDDCSTDNTIEIIEEYIKDDSRIKLVRSKKNGGAGICRNKGIELSSKRFIAFLDSDDYWAPLKLEKQISCMLDNGYVFSCSQYYEFDNISGDTDIHVKCPEKINYKMLLKNGGFIGCLTVVYDTEKFGKRYMPEIRKRQDWALWLKMLREIDFAYGIQEPLAYYRRGNVSLSKNKVELVKHNFNVYNKVLGMPYIECVYRMLIFLFHHFFIKPSSKIKL
ncbi:glycosyltransferase family 2 protein [Hyunsoonleella pacifica]|uniref:Glycosyltransferase family 2 protein n=1 Tax=Hyunsoonleella pacifica TaxID=1080224 RepID=A0A4Q9FQJ0_9FLAO|nr:glycosyltransferase family 2 protein [Hyunsoonleella pacifica]TBN16742.1 glycosyltransferase family 2 protein [Hyunsoonleella pacifica]GGD16826.1 glycosyl transferase [Hyunsoonleella pacifica]